MKIHRLASLLRLGTLGLVLAVYSFPAFGADRTFQSGSVSPNARVYGEVDRLIYSANSLVTGKCLTLGCSETYSNPVRISITAPGYGPVQLEVTNIRMPNTRVVTTSKGVTSPNFQLPLLLKGKVRLRHVSSSGQRQTRWAATSGTIFRRGTDLVLELVLPNLNSKRDPLSLVRLPLLQTSIDPRGHKNARVVSSAKSPSSACGHTDLNSVTEALLATSRPPGSRNDVSISSGELVNVAILADFKYFQSVGSGSLSRILSTMNQVDTIYERDIQASLNVSKVIVQTTSQGEDGPISSSVLLTSFTNENNSTDALGLSDAYIIATGRDIEGNVLGLANVAQLCKNRRLSYGLIQRQNDIRDVPTLAHELGHIFGAVHATDGGIMAATLGAVVPESFSSGSASSIKAYLSANYEGGCIGRRVTEATPTPTPRPTATRTATPVATATRTPGAPPPAPTATPKGGSGSNNPGSGDPRLPSVTLAATVDTDGTIEATLNNAEAISGSCEATFYGGFTPILARSRAASLGSGDFTDGELSIEAQVNGSATKSNSTTPIKVYLYGRIVCDGVASAESDAVAINTNRIKVFRKRGGTRQRVTFTSGKWFKQLAKTLTAK